MTILEQYARAKQLFLEARELAPEPCECFLEEACGRDLELRGAVQALLAHDEEDPARARDADLARTATAQADGFSAGEIFAGRYRMVSCVGRGGMGEVYRAEDLTLGVSVAIKFLRAEGPQHLARLLDEVRLARQVSHPAVCRVFDVGEAEGRHFFTMEYIEGEDLASQLRRIGRLPAARALELTHELCSGLAAAHDCGVLHRDLKPANVMVDSRGRARILDFGIAIGGREPNLVPVGTPSYMAPEQLVPGALVTEQTDLYALSLVLYELVTGQPAFRAATVAERLRPHEVELEPPSRWVPEIDPSLERVILAALQEDSRARPSSARAMARPLEASAPSAIGVSAAGRSLGEQRQLTVLFCELVQSTLAPEHVEPEARSELIRAYHESVTRIVERFDGQVVQCLGDGILACFSYPQAHDDDAARGVAVALEIVDELSQLTTRREEGLPNLRRAALGVIVGVDTGGVAVGEKEVRTDRASLAVAQPVSVASRLVRGAEPGWVVISERTHRLVQGIFVLDDLGEKLLAGVPAPVRMYRAVRATGASSRLEQSAASALTSMIGREHELALLHDRWGRATEGRGQVVLLSGEPGIGKSRLVHALRERLSDERHTWLECRCSALHTNSALHPMIELIERALLFSGTEGREEKIERLERALRQAEFDIETTLPLFATWLSIDLPDRYPPLQLSAEARWRRGLEALGSWLLNLAEQQPVILVVEDLQWVDPSSLELLGTLVEQAATVPLLILFSFRPELEPPWGTPTHLAHLTLGPLTQREIAAMVEEIARGKPLPTALLDRVVKGSDGVPLFVEELTKALLEAGLVAGDDGRPDLSPDLAIPPTLRDSLEARLDRLGPAKELARFAAVLGREFSYDLLEATSVKDVEWLDAALARLVGAELLYCRGAPPRASYTFKHSLIQTMAYESLLASRRREQHARVARVLEERFSDSVESKPELLGQHHEAAGNAGRAIDFYQIAGGRSYQRSANAEAVRLFNKALEVLEALPETPERNQQELDLQMGLGASLIAHSGYGASGLQTTMERARELAARTVHGPQTSLPLLAIAMCFTVRGELRTGSDVARQALEVAQRASDEENVIYAYSAMGICMAYQGEFSESLRLCEEVVARYDPKQHQYVTATFGRDQGVTARTYGALALWNLGWPARAVERSEEALVLARDGGHAQTLALALMQAASLQWLLRNPEVMRARAAEAAAIAEEHELLLYLGAARCYGAWASLRARSGKAALETLRAGLSLIQETGTEVWMPRALAVFAEACAHLGRRDEALWIATRALSLTEKRDTHCFDSQLNRLKGELLLGSDGEGQEAERCFRRAIGIARRQHARSLELRAAASLARLWQKRGQLEEARALLAPVYGWFTEGFDTPDLKDARALLEEIP